MRLIAKTKKLEWRSAKRCNGDGSICRKELVLSISR
jgi:hypothetical protein